MAMRVGFLHSIIRKDEKLLLEAFAKHPGVEIETIDDRIEQAFWIVNVIGPIFTTFGLCALYLASVGLFGVIAHSVSRRTREIGVRKAAGARNRDVLLQFLGEAVAVSSVGCVLGVALGYGVAHAVAYAMRQQAGAPVYPALTWETPAIAVTAAVMVGLTFGLYPALRAGRLSVVDAIRHE